MPSPSKVWDEIIINIWEVMKYFTPDMIMGIITYVSWG